MQGETIITTIIAADAVKAAWWGAWANIGLGLVTVALAAGSWLSALLTKRAARRQQLLHAWVNIRAGLFWTSNAFDYAEAMGSAAMDTRLMAQSVQRAIESIDIGTRSEIPHIELANAAQVGRQILGLIGEATARAGGKGRRVRWDTYLASTRELRGAVSMLLKRLEDQRTELGLPFPPPPPPKSNP